MIIGYLLTSVDVRKSQLKIKQSIFAHKRMQLLFQHRGYKTLVNFERNRIEGKHGKSNICQSKIFVTYSLSVEGKIAYRVCI
ncbi:Hypothetical predicted protein [Octopus vulgaris]|uniref:Uncharacterized protein n=1 Tax=Octopus vulgaris TaxID=6645 RepID=A0AA36B792_OCTVU|nr:Hypothetical predicted protein [Octopus vulgaris]